MAEDMGQKTELPTPRKRESAREKGQLARSTDLAAALDLCGGALLVWFFGHSIFVGLKAILARSLANDASIPSGAGILDPRGAGETFVWTMIEAGWIIAPALLIMWLVACLAQVQQVGLLVTFEPLQPKLDRLNPIAGFGRLFGKRSLVKTIVSFAKLIVVATTVIILTRNRVDEFAALPSLSAVAAFDRIFHLVMEMCAYVLSLLLILGAADWLYQRWQHTSDLKMTRQEVKDERKSGEGDPEIKARRLRIARELAMQRIRRDVPKADVIVTNPTHYSVAIKYDSATMHAPKVVAKGADWLALRIREVATANGVPIVEKPALARALYASVDEGRFVSPEYYQAVAELLAHVYRIQGRAA